ncbi:MAG TPA: PP2C family protein-serine/threonine phosphatase, partial [Acidimicrobiales bacterium]|nr:PP2C family protein-serine/threonine phosphatase [Acidimicrobiales bacterium]
MERPAEVVAGDSLAWLLATAHHLPPAELAGAVAEALARVGAVSSCLFLADHAQVSLRPFGPTAEESRSSFRVDGTVAGRAFALEMTCTVSTDCGVRLWVPVVDGTARLGVLAVDLTAEDARDAQTQRSVEQVASLAAQLLVTKSECSDAVELGRRSRKMSLAAELQRGTLPPMTLATSQVMVTGILEPAYEVAGDTFDYALNTDMLHVAIIDSVGHDIESSVVSHLVHGSLRNSRRDGRDLPEVYVRANEALTMVFRELTFATAAFGHLDLSSGLFSWVSAGHPPPLVVRGGKVV